MYFYAYAQTRNPLRFYVHFISTTYWDKIKYKYLSNNNLRLWCFEFSIYFSDQKATCPTDEYDNIAYQLNDLLNNNNNNVIIIDFLCGLNHSLHLQILVDFREFLKKWHSCS